MNEYQDEYKDFLRMIGSVVREDIRTKAYLDKDPKIEDLSKCLTKSNTEKIPLFIFILEWSCCGMVWIFVMKSRDT